jgi:hypothetical protein
MQRGLTIQQQQSPTSPRAFVNYAATYDGDECLLWPFSVSSGNGYGMVGYPNSKTIMTANRAVCIEAHGPPPFDKADAAHDPHICKSRLCVNRNHLRWGTRNENNLDKRVVGSHHGAHKLTPAAVLALRSGKLAPEKAAALYDVTLHHIIYNVIPGISWKLII